MFEHYSEILKDLKSHSHFRNIKDFTEKDAKYIYLKDKRLINLSSNNFKSSTLLSEQITICFSS